MRVFSAQHSFSVKCLTCASGSTCEMSPPRALIAQQYDSIVTKNSLTKERMKYRKIFHAVLCSGFNNHLFENTGV